MKITDDGDGHDWDGEKVAKEIEDARGVSSLEVDHISEGCSIGAESQSLRVNEA